MNGFLETYSSLLLKERLASKLIRLPRAMSRQILSISKDRGVTAFLCTHSTTLPPTEWRKNFFLLSYWNFHSVSWLHLLNNHSLDDERQQLGFPLFLWPSLPSWASSHFFLMLRVPQPPTRLWVCQGLPSLAGIYSHSILKHCTWSKHMRCLWDSGNILFLSLPQHPLKHHVGCYHLSGHTLEFLIFQQVYTIKWLVISISKTYFRE